MEDWGAAEREQVAQLRAAIGAIRGVAGGYDARRLPSGKTRGLGQALLSMAAASTVATLVNLAVQQGGTLNVPAPGGAGPVLKGQAGVRQAIADLEAAGDQVLRSEITVVTPSGRRPRLDLYVQLPNGQRAFLEVKNGPKAEPNANQRQAFPEIIEAGGTPVGGNAAGVPGLDQPLGPTPVYVVRLPGAETALDETVSPELLTEIGEAAGE